MQQFEYIREVSEWLKEHAWKVCIRQRIEGSNPFLSAILCPGKGLFYIVKRENNTFNPVSIHIHAHIKPGCQLTDAPALLDKLQ